jgi:hypothetical protein
MSSNPMHNDQQAQGVNQSKAVTPLDVLAAIVADGLMYHGSGGNGLEAQTHCRYTPVTIGIHSGSQLSSRDSN